MEGEEGGLMVRGRVEIDTRQPFRSVKEAVMLFGEKILAGEIYGKLKEMQSKANNGRLNQPAKSGAVTAELDETMLCLQNAKEDGNLMAHCLTSLRQELEHTKRELHQLKSRSETVSNGHVDDETDIEELKFVENTTKLVETINSPDINSEDGLLELQNKRSVTNLIVSKDRSGDEEREKVPNSSKKKVKKKPLAPLIGGWLFLKKGVKNSKS